MEYICIVLVLVGTFSKSYQMLVFFESDGLTGRVISPFFGSFLPYFPNDTEHFTLDPKKNCIGKCDQFKIELFVDHFKLEDSPRCTADFFQIIATCRGTVVKIGKYCGVDIPATFTMYGCQKVDFHFRTDLENNFDGYYITYQASPGFPPPGNKPYDIQQSNLRPANVYSNMFASQAERKRLQEMMIMPDEYYAGASNLPKKPSYAMALCIVMAVTFRINCL